MLPEELEPALERLRKEISEMHGYLDIDNQRKIVAELEERAAAPDFWNNQKTAQETIAKANAHKALLKPYDDIVAQLSDAATGVARILALVNDRHRPRLDILIHHVQLVKPSGELVEGVLLLVRHAARRADIADDLDPEFAQQLAADGAAPW